MSKMIKFEAKVQDTADLTPGLVRQHDEVRGDSFYLTGPLVIKVPPDAVEGRRYRVTLEPVMCPCPFCGGEAELMNQDDGYVGVKCLKCGAQGPWTLNDEDKAVSLWDRRDT